MSYMLAGQDREDSFVQVEDRVVQTPARLQGRQSMAGTSHTTRKRAGKGPAAGGGRRLEDGIYRGCGLVAGLAVPTGGD